jgi:hypothetical protein
MERHELEVIVKTKRAILDRTTLMKKGIKIPNPNRFMWTHTKHDHDKHVEQMEN